MLDRPLRVGDRVRVVAEGQFEGREGTIVSFRKPSEEDCFDIRVALSDASYGFDFEELELLESWEWLDRLLDPDGKSVPVAFVQGCVVLAIGAAMVLSHYVQRGFKWPSEVRDGP